MLLQLLTSCHFHAPFLVILAAAVVIHYLMIALQTAWANRFDFADLN
jgi:hypothetical protein